MWFDYIKKIIVLLIAAASISIVGISSSTAQSTNPSTALLQQIANNTNGILQQVTGLQTVLANLMGWTNPDDSQTTATLQNDLATIGNDISTFDQEQEALQSTINNMMMIKVLGASKGNLPNANDLVFSSQLNVPSFFTPDPRNVFGKPPVKPSDMALNYITNASGLNVVHVIPGKWSGSADDRTRYTNYFQNVVSIESFGAYALSNLYIDAISSNRTTTDQQTLIQMVNDPNNNWFTTVASENIGYVLRQLLMFQSESFVLLTQLLQTEKQILAATVMTNTLIITLNQQWETNFVSKAMGVKNQG